MDWRLVWEFFASVGYGLLSSYVPVFNSEVYIMATQTLGLTAEVTAALGVAVGQTIGKTSIVLALRHGTKLPFRAKHLAQLTERSQQRSRDRPPGRIALTYRRWSTRLLDLAGDARWGSLIVFLSAATGIPPMIALQLVIPATRMPVWVFTVVSLLGRCVFFLAVAFGASAIISRLF